MGSDKLKTGVKTPLGFWAALTHKNYESRSVLFAFYFVLYVDLLFTS